MNKSLREEAFISAMDAMQSYQDSRQLLHDALRAAFINLAACRHTLGGPHRMGIAQLPSLMTASSVIETNIPDGTTTPILQVAKGSKIKANSRDKPLPKQTSENDATKTEGFSNGILAELAAKYECAPSSETLKDEDTPVSETTDPIVWFGGDKSVKKVQSDFRDVLQLLLETVNADRKARASITHYLKASEQSAENK